MPGSLPEPTPTPAADTTIAPPKRTGSRERRFAFGKALRLKNPAAFDRVFKNATRSRDKYFTLLYRPNGKRYPRLGLAVAKKHCRHAHARNRIKRLVRETFRQQQAALRGVDVVVMCSAAAGAASNGALLGSLDRHWVRISQRPQTTDSR